MMKKIRTLLTTLVLMMTFLYGGVAAFAVNTGSPISPDKGNLTIHKYMFDVDGLGAGTGHELTDPDDLDKLKDKQIQGAQFDVYAIDSGQDEVKGGSDWTYQFVDNTTMKARNEAENITKQYAITLKSSSKTDAYGQIKLTDLDKGDYFVFESQSDETKIPDGSNGWKDVTITSLSKPFVVSVPMTDPVDLDAWISDIHVYPKNQETDVVKMVSDPSVSLGEEFEYSVAVELPSSIENYKELTMEDILEKSQTVDATKVKIYQAEKVNEVWVKTAPEATLGASDFTASLETTTNALKTELTDTGLKKVTDWEAILIEVPAKVTDKNQVSNTNTIKNKATVSFLNLTNQRSSKLSNEVEINIGDIVINKVGENGTDKLKDAEFHIALTEADAKAEKFIKVMKESGAITRLVFPNDTDYDTAEEWKAVSDVNGKAEFEGFKTVIGADQYQSYYLVETKAPEGYNLIGDPIEVSFDADSKDDNYIITTAITNKKGFLLPNTGGVGTLILTILGIVSLGLAVILSMKKKKAA